MPKRLASPAAPLQHPARPTSPSGTWASATSSRPVSWTTTPEPSDSRRAPFPATHRIPDRLPDHGARRQTGEYHEQPYEKPHDGLGPNRRASRPCRLAEVRTTGADRGVGGGGGRPASSRPNQRRVHGVQVISPTSGWAYCWTALGRWPPAGGRPADYGHPHARRWRLVSGRCRVQSCGRRRL